MINDLAEVLPSIAISVIANIVTILIISFAGYVAYLFLIAGNREEKLRFFGISRKKRKVSIYLSRIEVKPEGTVSLAQSGRGFVGSAITKLEYEGANYLSNTLTDNLIPYLSEKFQDWLGSNFFSLVRTEVKIETGIKFIEKKNLLSRDYETSENLESLKVHLDGSIIILLGSSRYNLLTKYYLEKYLPDNHTKTESYCYYESSNDDENSAAKKPSRSSSSSIGLIMNGSKSNVKYQNDEKNLIEYGFIQRVNDVSTKSSVFICVGLGSRATNGTAHFLADNWEELRRKYIDIQSSRVPGNFGGNKEFCLILEFVRQDHKGEDVVTPIVKHPHDWNS